MVAQPSVLSELLHGFIFSDHTYRLVTADKSGKQKMCMLQQMIVMVWGQV